MPRGRTQRVCWAVGVLLIMALTLAPLAPAAPVSDKDLDEQLTAVLSRHGFTGAIEA